jgi:hypothetical protein
MLQLTHLVTLYTPLTTDQSCFGGEAKTDGFFHSLSSEKQEQAVAVLWLSKAFIVSFCKLTFYFVYQIVADLQQ